VPLPGGTVALLIRTEQEPEPEVAEECPDPAFLASNRDIEVLWDMNCGRGWDRAGILSDLSCTYRTGCGFK
jgi:hypothetical protein